MCDFNGANSATLLVLEEGESISGLINFYGLEKENLFSKFSEEDENGFFDKNDLRFSTGGALPKRRVYGNTINFGTKKKSTKGRGRPQF